MTNFLVMYATEISVHRAPRNIPTDMAVNTSMIKFLTGPSVIKRLSSIAELICGWVLIAKFLIRHVQKIIRCFYRFALTYDCKE